MRKKKKAALAVRMAREAHMTVRSSSHPAAGGILTLVDLAGADHDTRIEKSMCHLHRGGGRSGSSIMGRNGRGRVQERRSSGGGRREVASKAELEESKKINQR